MMEDPTLRASIDLAGLTASPRVKSDGGILPPMVTYAQNFEDVMLRRALQDVTLGFYVDIGAADPDSDSVTRWFYENGWRGINVEPDPRYFAKLEERRPEDSNIQCVIGAISGNTIFNLTTLGGLSTGSVKRLTEITITEHSSVRAVVAPVIALDQLLAITCGKEIDFLKIDVEGMEEEILGSASLRLHRPKIIVVESTFANSQRPAHEIWEPGLLEKGYIFAWFDGLNRFYVREEDGWRVSFFKTPPCYFDNFFSVTIGARVDKVTERAAAREDELTRALAMATGQAADAVEQMGILQAELLRAKRQAAQALVREQAAEAAAAAEAHRFAQSAKAEITNAPFAASVEHANLPIGSNRGGLYSRFRFGRRVRASRRAAKLRDWVTAEANYASALKIDDRFPRFWLLYGHSLKEQGKFGGAERAYRRAVLLDSSNPDAHLQLGHALKLKGDLHLAIQSYSEAYRLQPSFDRARSELVAAGFSPLELIELVVSADMSSVGAAVAPGWAGRLFSSLRLNSARRATRRRNWSIAIGRYRKLTIRFPGIVAAWLELGDALRESGKLQEAQNAYTEALKRDRSRVDVFAKLAQIFELQNLPAVSRKIRSMSGYVKPG